MEHLIRELNSPANQGSSERIQSLQHQIQHLQRKKSAWQVGLDLLRNDDTSVKFYGALTLTVKINADWVVDGIAADISKQRSILQALIDHYVRLAQSGEASFVLQKLCSTLAALYHRLATSWLFPVRHVLASLLKGGFVSNDGLPDVDDMLNNAERPSIWPVAAAARFAVTLAEDITDRMGRANGQLLNLLSDNCLDTFHLLYYALRAASHTIINGGTSNDPAATSASQALDLAQTSIQSLQPWHHLLSSQAPRASAEKMEVTSLVVSRSLTMVLILYYEVESLRSFALQTLISVQQTAPKLLVKAEPFFPQSFMRSAAVHQTIKRLTEGSFEHEETLLVDLVEAIMSGVDFTSPKYLHTERLADVLQALQVLLRCEGAAAIEDTVCQVVLEIHNQLVDGYTDWTEGTEDASFLFYVRGACEACIAKATMPIAEMSSSTQTWDVDDRSRFSGFRFDVQDFLLASYSVLGRSVPEAILRNMEFVQGTPDWPAYEVSVFCLRGFADNMSDEPEKFRYYIEQVLSSRYFYTVLHSSEVPEQARKTTISFISDATAFLKTHSGLMEILNFLFSSLQLSSAAGPASQAIYTMCYDQRSSLTGALPGFMTSLQTLQDVSGMERHRIYGGVSAIIQALPFEQAKVEPIVRILQFLTSAAVAIEYATADQGALVLGATEILQSLAAVGRGLRTPNDVPVDLDASESAESDFWTGGPGSHVQQQVLVLYEQLMNVGAQARDSQFTEAASDFLRSGLTEEHPSPFKFTAALSTELITAQIKLDSPNIDSVLGCASCLLASAKQDEMAIQLSSLLSPVLSSTQHILGEHSRTGSLGDSSFPSATLDFVSRLLPKWGDPLLCHDEGPKALVVVVNLALVVMGDPDTLPRRSAASFFSTLIDLSKPQRGLSHTASIALDSLIQEQSPRVIALLLRLVAGECARSELEVLSDPVRRYVQFQPMLFKNIGSEVMKDVNTVLSQKSLGTTTLAQRNRFIAQVDGLRGQKKTNEVVKEFWISCRGSGFDYIV